jgi:hypothetical protein
VPKTGPELCPNWGGFGAQFEGVPGWFERPLRGINSGLKPTPSRRGYTPLRTRPTPPTLTCRTPTWRLPPTWRPTQPYGYTSFLYLSCSIPSNRSRDPPDPLGTPPGGPSWFWTPNCTLREEHSGAYPTRIAQLQNRRMTRLPRTAESSQSHPLTRPGARLRSVNWDRSAERI